MSFADNIRKNVNEKPLPNTVDPREYQRKLAATIVERMKKELMEKATRGDISYVVTGFGVKKKCVTSFWAAHYDKQYTPKGGVRMAFWEGEEHPCFYDRSAAKFFLYTIEELCKQDGIVVKFSESKQQLQPIYTFYVFL